MRLGRAIDTLPALAAEGRGPFDLVFIDADKASTPEYFAWALRLARRGSLIIVDNVVRGGRVVDEGSSDPNVLGMRRFLAALAAEPRVTATASRPSAPRATTGSRSRSSPAEPAQASVPHRTGPAV